MSTKRQVVGIRRPSDESEQNQMHEKKRLKVLHNDNSEKMTNDSDFGNHTPNPMECSVQNNLKKNIQPESYQIKPPNQNGSYNGYEENSLNKEPVNNFNESSLSKNGMNDLSSEKEATFNEASNSSSSDTVNLQSCEEHFENSQNIIWQAKEEASKDVLGTNNKDDINGSESLTDNSGQKCINSVKLEKESLSEKKNQESLSPTSQQVDSSRIIDSKAKSEVAKPDIDVDNLLLSHLKVTQLEGHADVVFCVIADEDIIISSSADTTIKVWDVEEKKEITSFAGHNDAVTSVILLNQKQSDELSSKLSLLKSPRIAISASLDCHVRLWSVYEGQELLSLYTFNGITCLGYLENPSYVVIGTEGGKLELWDLCLGRAIHFVYAHEDSVTAVAIEDSYVYSTSIDGTVKVWSFDENELQPLYTRRRKEVSQNKAGFGPAQWKAVSVCDNVLYLGDNSCNLKVLDWTVGRLKLFRNQINITGICEAVLAKNKILLSSFYDPSSDTGGINIWKLPDLSYVCTLTGEVQDICSLSMSSSEKSLRIVCGGHQLLVWDFDLTNPPKETSQDSFYVCEIEKIGSEVNEEPVGTGKMVTSKKTLCTPENELEKTSWCNVM